MVRFASGLTYLDAISLEGTGVIQLECFLPRHVMSHSCANIMA